MNFYGSPLKQKGPAPKKPEEKWIKIGATLPPDLAQAVEGLRLKRNVQLSELVRQALTREVEAANIEEEFGNG